MKDLYSQSSTRLIKLRNAISAVLRELPFTIEQPRDIYGTLGIDRMLGWKIFRFSVLDDIFLAAQYIPRKSAFSSFLKAASEHEASISTIQKAQKAFIDFTDLIDIHAGDRSSLDLMLMAFSQNGLSQIFKEQQKTAFLANRFIYGLETRVRFTTIFINPLESENILDITRIQGFVDLRQNRPNTQWLYEHPITRRSNGSFRSPEFKRSLVDQSELPGHGSIPWYPEFCSCEFPGIREKTDRVDFLQDIFPDSTGNTSNMIVTFGDVYRTENQVDFPEGDGTSIKITTPARYLVLDLFLHREFIEEPAFELMLFADINQRSGPHIPGYARSHRDRLPCSSVIRFMGSGIQSAYLHDVQDYDNMLRDVCRRRELDDSLFNLYRVRIEYPVIPSTVSILWKRKNQP